MKKVELRIPILEDMKYRQKWMMDDDTMSYNAGMECFIPGYNYETGTIEKNDEEIKNWFDKWVGQDNKYFAYIYIKEIEEPIGEVYFYKDNDKYKMGILIINDYRGRGFSEPALKELMKVAFLDYKVSELTDTFPVSREAAMHVFKRCGFIESDKEEKISIFGEEVINKELIITRDRYINEL